MEYGTSMVSGSLNAPDDISSLGSDINEIDELEQVYQAVDNYNAVMEQLLNEKHRAQHNMGVRKMIRS